MPQKRIHQLQTVLEIMLVLAVFAVFGGFPIPDSNEPYYIGKAVHFWNPNVLSGDTFLQTKDSHWTFYAAFGWLSLFLSPYAMALAGRSITWLMLAVSWQRLSYALVPVRWTSIVSAAALAYYVDSFNMAGEWLIGGIEGKSIAFPFVFLGLEAMVRGKWNRVWILLGIASAFHVLVGGWSVLVAMGVAACCRTAAGRAIAFGSEAPPPRWAANEFEGAKIKPSAVYSGRSGYSAIPSLILGGLISLFGLVPALMLDRGAAPDIVAQAHQIYVFERLYHHLDPYQLPWIYIARFALLTAVWLVLCRQSSSTPKTLNGQYKRWQRFEYFIGGTLLLSLIGLAVSFGLRSHKPLAAEILRFYWFRLSDVAVPMGVALGALRALASSWRSAAKHTVNAAQIPAVSLLLLLPFAVYLLADYLLFGRWFFSWRIPADQGIPWCIALLFCFVVLHWQRRRFGAVCRLFFVLLYAALVLYAPFMSVKTYADQRTRYAFSRTESGNPLVAYHWQDVCRWIADPFNTPTDARFLVPRDAATFKWFAHRSDIGVWKDIPQDACGIVAWRDTMHDLFFYRDESGNLCEDRSLTILLWWKTPEEVELLRQTYRFDYIVCAKYPELTQHKNLQMVYENALFAVFRVVPMRQ